MTNKPQSTIDNQNSQDQQPELEKMADTKSQIPNPKSKIIKPDIALSVKNLSKKFQLYETPKHRLKEALHPFRKKYHREFWALRDVSFEVKRGETLGIIGRNGAGKSTLLQIICGTMMPTQGEVYVNGRVSALLELGAGFNPEFTGTENVYMNGTIIGLSRKEMDERYQDIIDFADIGDFINQPVKVYSSGMYIRLAFAVAINVDPDILIIDEALAIGDYKFQNKCLKHLEQLKSKKDLTMIFVTHSLAMISNFTDKVISLNNGCIVDYGYPKEVINRYIDVLHQEKNSIQDVNKGQPFEHSLKLESNKLLDRHSEPLRTDEFDDNELIITFSIKKIRPVVDKRHVFIEILIGRHDGVLCSMHRYKIREEIKDILNIRHVVKNINLLPGGYTLMIYLYEGYNLVDKFSYPLHCVRKNNNDKGLVFFDNYYEVLS
jgi:ABC-type polysaccharide/polyol phosphate transport system ATPase subunit